MIALATVLLSEQLLNSVFATSNPISQEGMIQLTEGEKARGWKLLFDGQTLNGWHRFKGTGVGPGWRVENGILNCFDPSKAGDLVTDESFNWFELKIEYRVAAGSNSGLMFHVNESYGDYPWQSGPEIQIFDNVANKTVQQAGWLYDLIPAYIDATKPAGEWNEIHLYVHSSGCVVKMNGKRYLSWKMDDSGYRARIAKSKFRGNKDFGISGSGKLAVQGDHGVVSFRNMKVRHLTH